MILNFIPAWVLALGLYAVALRAEAEAHPLDPLTVNELSAAAEILRNAGRVDTNHLFVSIALQEPDKEVVRVWERDQVTPRRAFAVVVHRRANLTYEALVDLDARVVVSWTAIPGVQPMVTESEDLEAMKLVRENPAWREAMSRRGITNFATVLLTPWAQGHFPLPGSKDGRFYRVLSYQRGNQISAYGPPIEGVEAIVDLNRSEVVEVIDTGVRPVAPESTDFFDERVRGTTRAALRPIEVSQPDGPSFVVEGHEIRWDRWRFRYGFNAREGLVLYLVRFEDQGRERDILYRASLSEMLVPYGDPEKTWFWRNAFDQGEYGLGRLAVPLEPGGMTPAHATVLDVAIANDMGIGSQLPGRIELFERDGDTLWSHWDYEAGTEGRRARELIIGFTATVGNYDYVYRWIFREDGSIEFVAELTGVILTKGIAATECEWCRHLATKPFATTGEERYGTLLSPHVLGVNHQHFINLRLDFDIDGVANSVREINVRALRRSRSNPHGNAFTAVQTVFKRERQAKREIDPASHRSWAVFNPGIQTALGHYPAYMLQPNSNAWPFLSARSPVRSVAGFVDAHFFATRYRAEEQYAAGDYPRHETERNNLTDWIGNDENIENTDVVVWYTVGLTHIPRPEDYPVMPASRAGFKLIPKGFFIRNPALDVRRALGLPKVTEHSVQHP